MQLLSSLSSIPMIGFKGALNKFPLSFLCGPFGTTLEIQLIGEISRRCNRIIIYSLDKYWPCIHFSSLLELLYQGVLETQDDVSSHTILQLTDIAGPIIFTHDFEHTFRQRTTFFAKSPTEVLYEKSGK